MALPEKSKVQFMLRLNELLLWASALLYLVLIVCNLSRAPYSAWNDARLAPVAAWLRGFPFYATENSGVNLGNFYPPLGDLAFLPAGLFGHPVPATIVGAALSLLMNLSAGVGALVMWSRGQRRPFEIVLLGAVLYIALLLITGPTNSTLFAIHVDAPAIALMLWGVIFYARWWTYRKSSSLVISAILLSSVVWAKQVGFPLPVVYLAITLLIARWRPALTFAAWSLATSIVWPLVLTPVVADWHAFFFNNWFCHAATPWKGQITGDAFDRLRLYSATSVIFSKQYWLLYIVTLMVVMGLRASSKQSDDRSRFAFALVASAFIAGLTMLPMALLGWVKQGGDFNSLAYTLQPLLFALVIGGLAFLVAAKDAGARWHFVAQSVVCSCLLVFFATLRPGPAILRYPLEVSEAPLTTAYEQSKSGDYWFPEFPLSSLLATGRPYHTSAATSVAIIHASHSYAIYALSLCGRPVSLQQLSEGMPKAPFKLKYLSDNPENSPITFLQVPPGAVTEEQIGPWRQLLVKNFPAF
jgi:hypothetical protein